jgi:hypothetical protein
MADDAPDRLVKFLYLLTRDLVPSGYVEGLIALMDADLADAMDSDLKAWAERQARRLCLTEVPK